MLSLSRLTLCQFHLQKEGRKEQVILDISRIPHNQHSRQLTSIPLSIPWGINVTASTSTDAASSASSLQLHSSPILLLHLTPSPIHHTSNFISITCSLIQFIVWRFNATSNWILNWYLIVFIKVRGYHLWRWRWLLIIRLFLFNRSRLLLIFFAFHTINLADICTGINFVYIIFWWRCLLSIFVAMSQIFVRVDTVPYQLFHLLWVWEMTLFLSISFYPTILPRYSYHHDNHYHQ